LITTGINFKYVDYTLKKASFELDLTKVTNDVSDGNHIAVCASIVNTVDSNEVARLETVFDIEYTYASGEFQFSVSIDDPAVGIVLGDSKEFTIKVDAFMCDTNFDRLTVPEASIGQDIRVCTTPNQDSTAFQYSVTDYKDVRCFGNDGIKFFDITFEENSLNEVEGSIPGGANSFVFLLTEGFVTEAGYYSDSTERTLECSGKAVITTTNDRFESRDLEVSFGDSSRSLQAGDIQESDFGMSIGIEDSVAAAASARLISVATAIGSLVCAFFIM